MSGQLSSSQRLIRLRQVTHKTGKSRSAIYFEIKQGKFPKPVNISARCVAWIEREVDEWIAERIASRRMM